MKGAGQFITNANLNDRFWSRTREVVRREGIPYQWKALNDLIDGAAPSYAMHNFRVASGKLQGGHAGCVFQDSDVAKWIEGAAFSLRWHPDAQLEETIDGAIDDIVAAQQKDGYLNTYYIINGLDRRWTNLMDHHELYCAGHLLEAAVAYYQTTGKRVLLDAMIRYVDCIDATFGPEDGKMKGYPGHPVIEMALIRLYAITKDPKHLRLAKYFVDQRGQKPLYFEEECKRNHNDFYWKEYLYRYQYYQAGLPVREQMEAQGHAVRAMYLYAGMADVARETQDQSLIDACERLWNNAVRRRMYVTGAVGSSEFGEAFTFDYDLPNDTVYGETCASIGLVFFARRMLTLQVKGEYADVMERALYNGVISGMQLDGKKFFYVNPLEVLPEACEKDHNKRHVKFERQKWFGCACCPPNIIRLVSSLEEYLYSTDGESLYVHLYAGGGLQTELNGKRVDLCVQTDYPWDGNVAIEVRPETAVEFALKLRVPGWCRKYTLRVNGEEMQTEAQDGYISVFRNWKPGDSVVFDMAMPVELVRANPRIYEDAGKVAVMRGPLVYCLEEADNTRNLHLIRVGDAPNFRAEKKPERLGGIVELTSDGVRETDESWGETLYSADNSIPTRPAKLTWIPYYAWANRTPGEMRVWVRR